MNEFGAGWEAVIAPAAGCRPGSRPSWSLLGECGRAGSIPSRQCAGTGLQGRLRAPVRAGAEGTASTQLDTRMIVRRGGGVEGDEEIASRYFENARHDGLVPLAV